MVREIKFRAWDGDTMFYLNDGCYLCVWDDPQKVDWNIYSNIHGGRLVSSQHEGTVLMQYTGLKDKNGVDIYEGDHFGELAYPVEFSEGAFWHEGELLRDSVHLEVKGNIYENEKILRT